MRHGAHTYSRDLWRREQSRRMPPQLLAVQCGRSWVMANALEEPTMLPPLQEMLPTLLDPFAAYMIAEHYLHGRTVKHLAEHPESWPERRQKPRAAQTLRQRQWVVTAVLRRACAQLRTQLPVEYQELM